MSTHHQDDMCSWCVTYRCLKPVLICPPGVTKAYELTYESIEVAHALFDRNTASNHWTTRALFLKEFSEYFGPKAEQLDIYLEDGKVTFLTFTDKIVNSKNGRHPI